MFELYGICLCTAILTFLLLPYLGCRRSPAPLRHHTTESIRTFLNPPDTTVNDLLRSRSDANTHLAHTFHLTNTFISPDPNIHTSFLRQTRCLLHAANQRGWDYFLCLSRQAVDTSLPESSFSTFVQAATLRAIVAGLLSGDADVDMALLNSSDVNIVVSLIPRLWSLSKGPHPIQPALLATLNHHLRHLIPDQDKYPNPLDVVIPAWETLWRVVAVTVARAHNSPEGRDVFRRFAEIPHAEQFRRKEWVGNASAADWINETLRLHPPVKHITRAVVAPRAGIWGRFFRGKYTAVADIEMAQLAREEWGQEPEGYEPSRHGAGRPKALLAFGYGPLGCVAKDWAPMAAAAIVAAILDRVDGTNYEVLAGPQVGGRKGWDEWRIRKKN
ncbi:hypothetical protein B0H10DRAFT_1856175 [Mycena sp. CBHHK59/15]|nr:hypothetical protein B0H10DRAFT_1856175 [Mycena sp. CBHHK59/15]